MRQVGRESGSKSEIVRAREGERPHMPTEDLTTQRCSTQDILVYTHLPIYKI